MDKKRGIVTGLIVLLGIAGMIAGVYLLQQRTNLRQKAAVEGGRATLTLDPATGTYSVNQTIPMQVKFNTDGLAIDGIRVKLIYAFGGSTPGVSVADSDIVLNNAIFGTTGWSCTTVDSSISGQNVEVDIQCATTNFGGYSNTSDTLLATVNMKVNSVPVVNPVQVRFDPALSVFTAINGQDVLGTPQTVASYTVTGTGGGGATATNTPTPTAGVTATLTPTEALTSTPSPTGKVTVTPKPTTNVTATPTPIQELPDTGFSLPTILGIGFGAILLIGAALLLAI